MGKIYAVDLPIFLDRWDVPYYFYDDNWKTRSRSSGGWDKVFAIGIHHTASAIGTSKQQEADWCWKNSSDRPIGNVILMRDGTVCVGAAGASNTQGKGGPYQTTRGTIPQDQGNTHFFSIEAANNGLGEPWAPIQQEVYLKLCCAVRDWINNCTPGIPISLNDTIAHFEWAPDRKIDPAGQSLWATGSAKWNMDNFRIDLIEYHKNWNQEEDLPTEADFKEWMRDVLNELAVVGSDGTYKNTVQNHVNTSNQTYNLANSINGKVDRLLSEEDSSLVSTETMTQREDSE